MSKSSRLLTIRVPLRKICAALPAVALMGGGIAVSAPVAPAHNIKGVPVSSNSPAIVVPDLALTLPAQARISAGALPVTVPEAPTPEAPAPVLSKGAGPGSSSFVTLDSTGIPVRALQGYRRAATLINGADPGCHIDWALLAAIGRVESNHGRFGGSQLNSAGVDQPAIIGIPLDGSNGTARITDSDGGLLDGDTVYDRAVGPMQFIPSTWRVVGVDADGDGVKNPQDMADAATATAIYLCSGPGDLRRSGDLSAAIMRYNASDSYVRTVTALADTYRLGVSALPAPDLAPANSAPSTSVAAKSATKPTKPASGKPAPARPASTTTKATGKLPGLTPVRPWPSPPRQRPLPPVTSPPVTTPPVTTPPVTTPPVTTPPVTTPPVTTAPTPRPDGDSWHAYAYTYAYCLTPGARPAPAAPLLSSMKQLSPQDRHQHHD